MPPSAADLRPTSAPRRQSQAPIRDYGAIGDGRTVALIATDGWIDWLCLPNVDSPSVFGALIDHRRGRSFSLAPAIAFQAERRYLPDTNVLETTYSTTRGRVRVTDAMTSSRAAGWRRSGSWFAASREAGGQVPMAWRVQPRFGYAAARTQIGMRAGLPVASAGTDALAVRAWDAGSPVCDAEGIRGEFTVSTGSRALLALSAAHGEPLVFQRATKPSAYPPVCRLPTTA